MDKKINVKDGRMYSLIVLYDICTEYFPKAIEGISDKDVNNRLNTKANHVAWLAGSLVNERFEMAKTLGKELKQTSGELFKDHKGIQDSASYPSLTEYKTDWETVTPVLRDLLLNIGSEKLDSKFEMMPGETMTYFELMSFMAYRESNIIGQILLWRRLLGYEAMKYD